ncbi:unnamed protein product [Heligmosomoides polygyrus]|uniref:Uncharacterized protein n=1 Tax=Heligmosomoides polygyrus TaxID=6339 RepID=A0A3P8BAC0_HELPZ|nr:unnamed protein product [Heligmosomoides polygyrus]
MASTSSPRSHSTGQHEIHRIRDSDCRRDFPALRRLQVLAINVRSSLELYQHIISVLAPLSLEFYVGMVAEPVRSLSEALFLLFSPSIS